MITDETESRLVFQGSHVSPIGRSSQEPESGPDPEVQGRS